MRLMTVAPAAAATVAMMTLTLNLWLAAKVTAISGRLRRPWPDLKTIDAAANDAGGDYRGTSRSASPADCLPSWLRLSRRA